RRRGTDHEDRENETTTDGQTPARVDRFDSKTLGCRRLGPTLSLVATTWESTHPAVRGWERQLQRRLVSRAAIRDDAANQPRLLVRGFRRLERASEWYGSECFDPGCQAADGSGR